MIVTLNILVIKVNKIKALILLLQFLWKKVEESCKLLWLDVKTQLNNSEHAIDIIIIIIIISPFKFTVHLFG